MSVGYMAKCAWKKQHVTQELAEAQRRHLVRIGKYRWSRSNTYLCNVCWHWHAGRIQGSANRGKAKGHSKAKKGSGK